MDVSRSRSIWYWRLQWTPAYSLVSQIALTFPDHSNITEMTTCSPKTLLLIIRRWIRRVESKGVPADGTRIELDLSERAEISIAIGADSANRVLLLSAGNSRRAPCRHV